jgi:hypothetical protein
MEILNMDFLEFTRKFMIGATVAIIGICIWLSVLEVKMKKKIKILFGKFEELEKKRVEELERQVKTKE